MPIQGNLSVYLKQLNKPDVLASVLFLLGLIIVALLYYRGVYGPFLLDDRINIPVIKQIFSYDYLLEIVFNNHSGVLGRPVAVLSFISTALLHGNSAWGFKYHNILLHLVIGIVIFLFSVRLLMTTQGISAQRARIVSSLVMVIWLMHPLHVSTVLYAVQRMTQLSALFALLALLSYLYALTIASTKSKLLLYFLLVPLCGLLGVFSKENAVLLPIFIILLYYFYRKTKTIQLSRLDHWAAGILGLLPTLLGIIVFLSVMDDLFVDYLRRDFTLYERLLSQINIMCLYLQQLLMPKLSAMGLYLDDIPMQREWTIILSAKFVLLCGLITLGIQQLRKGHLAGLGMLFFFAGHLLESTVLPLELAFEHRNYLPSLGVIFCLADIVLRLPLKDITRIAIAFLYMLLFAVVLNIRIGFWKDMAEWQHTMLAYHQLSSRTWFQYILNLHIIGEEKQAMEALAKARVLMPDKLGFSLAYLIYTCDPDDIQNPHAIQSAIGEIENTLAQNNMSPGEMNILNILLEKKLTDVRQYCPSVSVDQILNFILLAKKNMESTAGGSVYKLTNYGYLAVLYAKLMVAQEKWQQAGEYFQIGFLLTERPFLLLLAVQAFLLSDTTKDQAYALLAEIEQGQYFPIWKARHGVQSLKEKIEILEQQGQVKFSF